MLVKRVFAWNALRYDQELSLPLQLSLQSEEFRETIAATNDVERLDGHVDQQFVAIGGLWKLGLDVDDACTALEACDAYWGIATNEDTYAQVEQRIASHLDMIQHAVKFGASTSSLCVVFAGIAALNAVAMDKLGYTQQERFAAAQIVCYSNDSKSVKKTASDVKANTDKGPLFIDPTPRLQTIVDAVLARRQ